MKALLLDADGVVLEKGELFSEKFAREHNVPTEEIVPFFRNELPGCQSGEKDLKEILPPYLEKWGWDASVDSFLEYWFEDVQLNPKIEQLIERCHEQGVSCYMASNNEHYRARVIEQKLKGMLDGFFFSSDLKVRKEDTAYFEQVLQQLQLKAADVGFVDNEEKNIEAAREVGLEAKLHDEDLFSVWPELKNSNEFKIR